MSKFFFLKLFKLSFFKPNILSLEVIVIFDRKFSLFRIFSNLQIKKHIHIKVIFYLIQTYIKFYILIPKSSINF